MPSVYNSKSADIWYFSWRCTMRLSGHARFSFKFIFQDVKRLVKNNRRIPTNSHRHFNIKFAVLQFWRVPMQNRCHQQKSEMFTASFSNVLTIHNSGHETRFHKFLCAHFFRKKKKKVRMSDTIATFVCLPPSCAKPQGTSCFTVAIYKTPLHLTASHIQLL